MVSKGSRVFPCPELRCQLIGFPRHGDRLCSSYSFLVLAKAPILTRPWATTKGGIPLVGLELRSYINNSAQYITKNGRTFWESSVLGTGESSELDQGATSCSIIDSFPIFQIRRVALPAYENG